MIYEVLADATLLVHLSFVLFVIFGGVALFRWRRLIWLHLPAAAWGVVIELAGGVCPLTYLENHFRRLGGETGYSGSFIEHYLEPLLYPQGLTDYMQIALGLAALLVNLCVYFLLWHFRKKKKP